MDTCSVELLMTMLCPDTYPFERRATKGETELQTAWFSGSLCCCQYTWKTPLYPAPRNFVSNTILSIKVEAQHFPWRTTLFMKCTYWQAVIKLHHVYYGWYHNGEHWLTAHLRRFSINRQNSGCSTAWAKQFQYNFDRRLCSKVLLRLNCLLTVCWSAFRSMWMARTESALEMLQISPRHWITRNFKLFTTYFPNDTWWTRWWKFHMPCSHWLLQVRLTGWSTIDQKVREQNDSCAQRTFVHLCPFTESVQGGWV